VNLKAVVKSKLFLVFFTVLRRTCCFLSDSEFLCQTDSETSHLTKKVPSQIFFLLLPLCTIAQYKFLRKKNSNFTINLINYLFFGNWPQREVRWGKVRRSCGPMPSPQTIHVGRHGEDAATKLKVHSLHELK